MKKKISSLKTELELFLIGTITLSKETILFLNVGVSEIRSIKEFDKKTRDIKSNNYRIGVFNSAIKRLLCQTKCFIGRQGLSINLLSSWS
jgi:hypothetical protein